MKREIYNQLLKWKVSHTRKPLMLYGARQVGKTYILKEFGRNEFENFVYVNCYMNNKIAEIFERDVDPNRIIKEISLCTGHPIIPGETFLILDEVQECPQAVASLKYFCEEMPALCVAAAGSLLGVMNMQGCSFPVGKVDILHLYPMTFLEFLRALDENFLLQTLTDSRLTYLIDSSLDRLIDLLRQYYFSGGMPEAVKTFIDSGDLDQVRTVQNNILTAYFADIAKHAGRDAHKVRMILEAIPSQLAKENKKFIFGAIRKGARAAEYENAIQWLVDAGLIYKVCRVTKAELPLTFYMEREFFKIFLLDVGLLGALSNVPPQQMITANNIFKEFKGAFTENYVVSQLESLSDCRPICYYSKDNSTLEVDFIVQYEGKVMALEVKAEENVHSKSFRQFVTVDNAGNNLLALRVSMKGMKDQGWMTNVPLPAFLSYLKTIDSSSK